MIDIKKIEIFKMLPNDLEEIKQNLQTDFDDFWNFEIFKEEQKHSNILRNYFSNGYYHGYNIRS